MSPTATELEAAGLLASYARVSDVLREAGLLPDFTKIPPSILERKRAIGTATHRALELLIQGRLDRSSIAPEVAPYFSAGERWLIERKPFVVACEETVCDKTRLIKGTLDLRVRLDGREIVVDFKTSSALAPSASVQACGYVDLLAKDDLWGLVVQLKKDGAYHEATPDTAHMDAWDSAATLYCFRRDNGLLRKGEAA